MSRRSPATAGSSSCRSEATDRGDKRADIDSSWSFAVELHLKCLYVQEYTEQEELLAEIGLGEN
jgi:hypothetical protein